MVVSYRNRAEKCGNYRKIGVLYRKLPAAQCGKILVGPLGDALVCDDTRMEEIMYTMFSRYSYFLSILSFSLAVTARVQAKAIYVERTNLTVAQIDTQQQTAILNGSGLLYYLYKRYNALQNANDFPIYREEKGENAGAIYYRKNNASHTVVWLKGSPAGVQVPLNSILQYLPDYKSNNEYVGLISVQPKQLYGGLMETAYSYAIAHGLSPRIVTQVKPQKPNKQATASLTTKQVIQRVLPSVVRLTVLNKDSVLAIQGSGIVVGEDLIATNMHVVDGGHAVTANFESGRSEAVFGVIGADSEHDLVLLRAFTHGIPILTLDSDNAAQVGDPVIAIGSPEGLGGSVSTGIVSGIRLYNGTKIIQTTAPISHGSSGGCLVNMQGQVIGITSFFNSEGQNLNFAYPAYFLEHLISHPFKQILTWNEIEEYSTTHTASASPTPPQPVQDGMTSRAADTAVYTNTPIAGLKGLAVTVSVDDEAKANGVDDAELKVDAENRLRNAGITVFSDMRDPNNASVATLDISISTTKLDSGLYANSIDISLNEVVTLRRPIPVRAPADIWSDGSYGTVGSEKMSEGFKGIVERAVDKFAKVYRAQNPVSP